jgi:hypothetical protein
MKIAYPSETQLFFKTVARAPFNFTSVLICSPYITPTLLKPLLTLRGKMCVPTTIITLPETSKSLKDYLPSRSQNIRIASVNTLHAKAYLGIGVDPGFSVLILGSFNLTESALNRNIELGLKFQGNDKSLITIISAFEKKLVSIFKNNAEERCYYENA